MKHKMYTVYDSAAGFYLPPFYLKSKGEALRIFADSVNDPTHGFAKHPKDYTLFEIGEYDDETAKVESLLTPLALGNGLEYKQVDKPVLIDQDFREPVAV